MSSIKLKTSGVHPFASHLFLENFMEGGKSCHFFQVIYCWICVYASS